MLHVHILIPEDSTMGNSFSVLLNTNKKATLQPQVIKAEKVSGTGEGQVKQGSNEDKEIVLTLQVRGTSKRIEHQDLTSEEALLFVWVQKSLKLIKVRYLMGVFRCPFRNSHV